MDWDDFVGTISDAIKAKYKSFEDVKNEWDGRETRIILRNTFAEIGISEYCGCASLSIRVRDDLGEWYRDKDITALGENWVDNAWDGILKTLDTKASWLKRLNRIGGFSNGESVYERAA